MKSLLVFLSLTLACSGCLVAANSNPQGYFVILTSFSGNQPFPKVAKVGNERDPRPTSLNCESGFGSEAGIVISCGDPLGGPFAGGLLSLHPGPVVSGSIQFKPPGPEGSIFLSCKQAATGVDIECR